MPYTIRRSTRTKKIKLAVKSDGTVELVIPKFVPLFMGKSFATLHEDWIEKHSQKAKNKLPDIPTEDGAMLPFLGRHLRLNLQKSIKNKVEKSKEELIVSYKNKKYIAKNIEQFYREAARKVCTERVVYFTEKMNLNFGTIRIKNQKTRWGSCSGKGNINFNWKIVKEKMEIIDYLVIHEICHLKEMNHSKRFWKLVEDLDPKYREHAKYLKGQL